MPLEHVGRGGEAEVVDELRALAGIAQVVLRGATLAGEVPAAQGSSSQQVTEAALSGEQVAHALYVVHDLLRSQVGEIDIFLVQRPHNQGQTFSFHGQTPLQLRALVVGDARPAQGGESRCHIAVALVGRVLQCEVQALRVRHDSNLSMS
eukprot:CAMPEP_0173272982 /NCGR_PEP_ID=MMETSP1143-20121109/1656_1 /TAXON_ID=483371 /ORGANISM="non described non described, Strain CCMP2298" /LENGTH=149 /DNA_ID=CAMNT_0014209681 /DNA_START=330 /DNA_END=776 /DNA_ORIENTATION=-